MMNGEKTTCGAARGSHGRFARRVAVALTLLYVAALPGCSIWRAPPASFRPDETELARARAQATVVCFARAQCDAIWARAGSFVRARATTRIVQADDTLIETASPAAFGVAWFWAERAIAGDGRTVVRLKGMCRGMYNVDGGPGWMYETCSRQIVERERAFRQSVLTDD